MEPPVSILPAEAPKNNPKRGRGRPKKKKRGPVRRTILAPQKVQVDEQVSRPTRPSIPINKEDLNISQDKLNGDKSSENLLNEKRGRGRPRKIQTSEGQADNQGPVSAANDSLEVGKRNLRARVIDNGNQKGGFSHKTKIYHNSSISRSI